MTSVEWADPPPNSKMSPALTAGAFEFAAALRKHPGRWALVTFREFATGGAASGFTASIRQARVRAFQPYGSYEATARGTQVWARYVGPS